MLSIGSMIPNSVDGVGAFVFRVDTMVSGRITPVGDNDKFELEPMVVIFTAGMVIG